MENEQVIIGLVSISDRASTGVYEDKGLPALKDWLSRALKNPLTFEARLIADEKDRISAALIDLVDAGWDKEPPGPELPVGVIGPHPDFDGEPEPARRLAERHTISNLDVIPAVHLNRAIEVVVEGLDI